MIKKALALILIGLTFQAAVAAKKKLRLSDKELEIVAEETCACISGMDPGSMDENELTAELGLCMLSVLGKHDLQDKIDVSDQAALFNLGELVGLKMTVRCPGIFVPIVKKEIEANSAQELLEVEGTITGLQGEDLNFLTVRDATGRRHRLLWLGYFSGSDRLLGSGDVEGVKVRVSYRPLECFLPKIADYGTCNEIREITFLD